MQAVVQTTANYLCRCDSIGRIIGRRVKFGYRWASFLSVVPAFMLFSAPPPPFLIEFYGETVCLFNLPLWIHLQCDRSSLCFRMCQWDHDNASQTVKVCILIDYPWSSLATSSATNSTPGGTERRGWGGVKGREKTLKSFKRICVNSSKTSLCDVSQSIGD